VAFVAWLKESPRHVREILLATTWDRVLGAADRARRFDIDALLARGSNDIVVLNSGSSRNATRAVPQERSPADTGVRRYRRFAGLAAAAVLVSLATWACFGIFGHTYATAVGGQRNFELGDGSMIYMSARSKVKVDVSRSARDVYLLAGEVIFRVKHEAARPFRVHVDGAFIQAVGTQFDVHRLADQTSVAVIEGKVKISAQETEGTAAGTEQNPGTVTLVAGEASSIISSGRITQPAPVDIAEATAWQQRRLVFRKQTLANMALEFNRYNREIQIRVEGDTLRARRFNGVFDADDPDSLVRFLESSEEVAVERHGSDVVIRGR
jgi:transmembrane sensor